MLTNNKNDENFSFLEEAIKRDSPKDLIQLVKSGIDVNIRSGNGSDWGQTALKLAAHRSSSVVNTLLNLGADPNLNSSTYHGLNPLMIACQRSPQFVEPLIKAGARVNNLTFQTSNTKKTALMIAVQSHPSVVKLLLEAQADINMQDHEGKTALMHAILHRPERQAQLKLLMEHGANLELMDKSKMNALMYTIKSKSIDNFKLLIDYISTLNNPNGQKLIDYAKVNNQSIYELLLILKEKESLTSDLPDGVLQKKLNIIKL